MDNMRTLKNRKPPRRYHRYVWLFGFVGLLGFRYFATRETTDLFYFSFLAFFSNCFTARLAAEMPDERYEGNRLKAKAATMFVPAIALFVIGIGIVCLNLPEGFVVSIVALGWAATFLTYAIAFWYYEKH